MQNGQPEMNDDTIAMPVGDPNVIRTLQFYSDLARQGKIIGLCVIGITPTGDVHSTPTLQPNPATMQLAMGALTMLIADVGDMVRAFRKPMTPSAIIRPNNGIRPHG